MLSDEVMLRTKELYMISKSIKILYDKLCELEMNGLKDSVLYNQYIDYLRIALDVEENEYRQINDNDTLVLIHDFADKKKERIFSRISVKTDDLINLNDSNYSDAIMTANFITELVYNVFFSIIDEEIINNNRKDLIKYKYDNIFSSVSMESYAVFNKFNMFNNHNYIVFDDNLPISFDDIKNHLLVEQFSNLSSLKLVNDFDSNSIDDIIDISYLRACLVLLDDKDVEKLYDSLYNISKLNVNKNFLACLYNLFDKNKDDKEKHKVNKLVI